MARKRITKAKLRAVLGELPRRFTTTALHAVCRTKRVSFDQAVRRLRTDGLAVLVDSEKVPGKTGRPSHVYEKTEATDD